MQNRQDVSTIKEICEHSHFPNTCPCKFYVWISIALLLLLLLLLLATVAESNLKVPFSVATTPRCRRGHYFFPWIAPLYP